jgi:hypothetical protein
MTIAVCFRCGAIKFGAFVPCTECGADPKTEDDLALSLAMTDHYFDRDALEQMGRRVAEGHPPKLDPQTRQQLVESFRGTEVMNLIQPDDPPPSPRRPWWRFW